MLFLEARYGDGGVVVDTEAAGLRVQGVVEAARDAHGVGRLAADDEPTGPQYRADHAGAGVVHVGEDRVVPRAESVVHQIPQIYLAPPGLLDHAHVGQAVDSGEVLVGRGLRRDQRIAFQKPQRLAELEGKPNAQGVEGMAPAEPVALERQVVDDGRRATHGFGGHRTE
jgi:hypothetical protein